MAIRAFDCRSDAFASKQKPISAYEKALQTQAFESSLTKSDDILCSRSEKMDYVNDIQAHEFEHLFMVQNIILSLAVPKYV